MILKKDKDPLDPSSFRPVSLVSVDFKVITKVLAMRLENILPDIIHEAQVRFVRGRSSSDNFRWLLHLIWMSREENTPVAVFSLDAEKAFDRIEWVFLILVLEAFGFGSGFINWVKMIYREPRAFKPIETLSQNAVGSLTGEESNPVLQYSSLVWAKLDTWDIPILTRVFLYLE